MGKVTIFNQSIPAIGYVARTTTLGEEFDMVNQYIEAVSAKYSKATNMNAAIFIEPQVGTSYPDIVIVEYTSSPVIAEKPTQIMRKLSITDLKILFFIHNVKYATDEYICQMLAYSLEEVRRSINRLSMCNLIYKSSSGKSVRKKDIKRYCSIKKVIAIEAKINKWNEAIGQADQNVWFATESYVLLNREKCTKTTIERCKAKGIGIILINGKFKQVLKSASRKFPVSYASMLFGEWIHRNTFLEEGNP